MPSTRLARPRRSLEADTYAQGLTRSDEIRWRHAGRATQLLETADTLRGTGCAADESIMEQPHRVTPHDVGPGCLSWWRSRIVGRALLLATAAALVVACQPTAFDNASDVTDLCHAAVKSALNAPVTVRFRQDRKALHVGTTTDWSLTSEVDSQNSYGALMRTGFLCRGTPARMLALVHGSVGAASGAAVRNGDGRIEEATFGSSDYDALGIKRP